MFTTHQTQTLSMSTIFSPAKTQLNVTHENGYIVIKLIYVI